MTLEGEAEKEEEEEKDGHSVSEEKEVMFEDETVEQLEEEEAEEVAPTSDEESETASEDENERFVLYRWRWWLIFNSGRAFFEFPTIGLIIIDHYGAPVSLFFKASMRAKFCRGS